MSRNDSFVLDYVRQMMASDMNQEEKAYVCLSSGQMMERNGKYELALQCYSEAFSLEPLQNDVWYFLHNNLGYCLNGCSRFEQAEAFCRQAIAINPMRHNAYKNLGIALAGLQRFGEAAQTLVQAVELAPRDPRALLHLEELFGAHPEIEEEIHGIFLLIERCRLSVQEALGIRDNQ